MQHLDGSTGHKNNTHKGIDPSKADFGMVVA